MDIQHIIMAEKNLKIMEDDIDPFFKLNSKFVDKKYYLHKLSINLDKAIEDLDFYNKYTDIFVQDNRLEEFINSIRSDMNACNSITNYLSITRDAYPKIIKSYSDNLDESFLDYIKETYPHSYKNIDLSNLSISNIDELELFLQSETIVASSFYDFLIRKDYSNKKLKILIVEKDGIKAKKVNKDFFKEDFYELVGNIIIKEKGLIK